MPYRLMVVLSIVLAGLNATARGDTVFVKGREKGVYGDIKSEDAKGITALVKKANETFPALDIIDVHYDDVKPAELRLSGGAYKVAKDSEKDADSADPVKRKTALTTSIAKYNETLKKMDPHKYATRTIRYKIALLSLKLAQHEKLPTDKAIGELQRYKSEFPNSWQVNHVMPMIAQTQMDAGDFKAAAATFDEMVFMDTLPADVKTNAKLMVVQVAVRAGDIPQAQKKLAQLEAEAKGNPKFASRVKMAKAEVLVGLKKTDEALPLLQQVVKENSDRDIKAMAHNTLGECLFKANRFNEARWEFIWVDTVFNQDRTQHARALYFLAKTFQNLNDEPRAQECRELLMGPQFTGTEWQQKALKEAGK